MIKPHHLVITTATPYCKHQTTALMMIQTTPPGYHYRHTILQTSNHSSYDDTNHTTWLSPPPHHTANIKPQLLRWYKPHQLVITTATPYCTRQTTVPHDDKNHTSWSSHHHTVLHTEGLPAGQWQFFKCTDKHTSSASLRSIRRNRAKCICRADSSPRPE